MRITSVILVMLKAIAAKGVAMRSNDEIANVEVLRLFKTEEQESMQLALSIMPFKGHEARPFTVIQIGANDEGDVVGDYMYGLENAYILAIEPEPQNFAKLRERERKRERERERESRRSRRFGHSKWQVAKMGRDQL